jgi:hypothetical protein
VGDLPPETEADDGAIQDFWTLSEDEIRSLEPMAGDPDPGANQAVPEP